MVIVAPTAVELATAWPTRLICRVRQPEVLYPHHENDIIPVVLQKPDDHWTLAVAFHAGHRFTDIEWHAYPAHRYRVGNPGCEAFHLVDLGMTANHVIVMPILYHHA